MSEYNSNYEIAQAINARIGDAPIPFDSVYGICLQIYNELGGDPAEFDSVYEILLGILPLVEGGGSKSAITEVDELPDARENKDSIYRLTSDDKVYMSELMSREYTNRLPNEQQIDRGYIYQDENIYYYNGQWTAKLTDGEVAGYGWIYSYNYDGEHYDIYLTQDDAVSAENTTKFFYFSDTETEGIDFENHIIIYDDSIEAFQWEDADTITDDGGYVIPAIYNAPEADCIGNATLTDAEYQLGCVYTGEEVQYYDEDAGEQRIGYKWVIPEEGSYDYDYVVTSKKASEIYYIKGTGWAHSDANLRSVVDGVGVYADYWDLYIPQLNAPDSEQIGKAYIFDNNEGDEYLYTDVEKTIVLADRTVTAHLWGEYVENPADWVCCTLKPAYQIYGNNDLVLVNLDSYRWDVNGNTITTTDGLTYAEFESECFMTLNDKDYELNNLVKYQRAIENWEWKQIPTMDDIPQVEEYHAGQNISIDASNNISAEGYVFNATGDGEIAIYYYNDDEEEMMLNTARGSGSHAEGYNTTATTGWGVHSEGVLTNASGDGAHAEGQQTTASGRASHAEGDVTVAQNVAEHAEGRFNLSHKANTTWGNAGNTQHSIGIGAVNNKKNAFEVMQNGDVYVYGVGGYLGVNTKVQDATIKTVQDYVSARETYIDTNFAKVVSLTQAQYNALTTKSPTTLYIITDAQ